METTLSPSKRQWRRLLVSLSANGDGLNDLFQKHKKKCKPQWKVKYVRSGASKEYVLVGLYLFVYVYPGREDVPAVLNLFLQR